MLHVTKKFIGSRIIISTPTYRWEWDNSSDMFSLYDSQNRLIGSGEHQPFIVTAPSMAGCRARERSFEMDGDCLHILYRGVNGASRLTVTWLFRTDSISLQPLLYESATEEDIQQIIYFASLAGDYYKPSFYSRYAVLPGLSMSTNISPVVDLHSRLSVTTVLGSGAMRGPGFTQQWGLPAHYFCTFNTSAKWNAIGAKAQQSDAVCWGLAELPDGDFRLELREIGLSPICNVRSDLWKQYKTPGTLELGFSFLLTFGSNYYEAIRNYYKALLHEKIIKPKENSSRKNTILLAPQYNTWGVESAKAMRPEDLTEETLRDTFDKLQRSGMKARTFVIDDKWEGQYGELQHDAQRFPNFENLLNDIRQEGYFIGLWAAFLRCQDPSSLGLKESHLLQTRGSGPLCLSHGDSRYGIFDVTQPAVQNVLRERAREFIHTYKPDLIKFDFGYELPSLDVAAPLDRNYTGERLLQKGLDVIVGAMREVNPDLVIMYYGLSPLLIEYYDLHSPDDLVYCAGDYDLETNRRIFFSSLCGELGMPTYGSSGYDWGSALDIWFDSAPSGTLGSLHCFDGDENGDLARQEWIAKYNGLSAILRASPVFQIYPIDVKWQGGFRAGFAPSWERMENGQTVLLALRTHRWDGKPALSSYKDILNTNVTIVVASMTEADISHASRIGIVPFGDGSITVKTSRGPIAQVTEHYWSGRHRTTTVMCQGQRLTLPIQQLHGAEILEWIEILFDGNALT